MDPKSKNEEVVGGTKMKSPEGVSNSASLEMEMGSGGYQVKLEEAGAVATEGSEGQVKAGNSEENSKDGQTFQDLEGLVKNLHVEGGPQGKVLKMDLVSKLAKARNETADRERAIRRMKWKEEIRMELLKREEAKRQMASTPLKKVTDWKAKADMSKMSMRWRDAFKIKRTSFLFDKVLPILYWKTPMESQGNLVLTCRPVSKLWKVSTEACIRPRFERGVNDWDAWKVRGSYSLPVCCFSFSDKRRMGRFNYWSEHGNSGKNPFFSRRLAFAGGNAEWKNNLEFWREGEALLRRWGTEIWVFAVNFDKGMTFEVMYEQLMKYLKLMPNLLCLAIADQSRRGINSMLVTDMMRDLGKDIYGPLRARMSRNPLPELPQLKYLLFHGCVVAPLAQAALARYSGRLEVVTLNDSVDGERADPMTLLTEKDLKLPQMRMMCVTSFAPPNALDLNASCWPSFVTLSLKHPHLQSAEDVLTIFQNLNLLRPVSTFRRLTLTLQPIIQELSPLKLSDEQLRSLFLELPQLDWFEMNVIHLNLKNIDFILPCASLKELRLIYHKFKSVMPTKASASGGKAKKGAKDSVGASTSTPPGDEIIQFFEYTNRLYESNLWKLFPELKVVSLAVQTFSWELEKLGMRRVISTKTKLYTREGYRRYLGGY